jgi:predicted ATP-grasp superfamily ATP-dependent carboligase
MRALVLDGHVKSALATVRSLGRRGVPVTVGAERKTAMALWSRYASSTFVYRSPIADPTGFLDDVEAEAKQHSEPPVVFCMSDATMLLLSRNRERFSTLLTLVVPSVESVETAADKLKTRDLAVSLEIPTVPEATFAQFPVVVKPRHSASWVGQQGVSKSVMFAFTQSEAEVSAGRLERETGESPLIQEYVHGAEFGFEALCIKGEVVAHLMHRRIRSLSPTGGAAVVKVTMEPDPTMRRYAETILKALSWDGVAMVEFKQDDTTGRAYLLEINPRFWGSLPLALHAGVDFPFLYALVADGRADHAREIGKADYERRVASRHFLGDLRHLSRVWFSRDRMRARAYPGRLRALGDFLSPGFHMRPDVFDWKDPLPCIMEAVDHL